MQQPHSDRRRFIQHSAATGAALSAAAGILPAAQPKKPARKPLEKVRVGFVGVGVNVRRTSAIFSEWKALN